MCYFKVANEFVATFVACSDSEPKQREIRLVSMTGSLVSKQTLSGELGQVRLSLEGQKPGVYILQVISSSGEITTKKIIKQ